LHCNPGLRPGRAGVAAAVSDQRGANVLADRIGMQCSACKCSMQTALHRLLAFVTDSNMNYLYFINSRWFTYFSSYGAAVYIGCWSCTNYGAARAAPAVWLSPPMATVRLSLVSCLTLLYQHDAEQDNVHSPAISVFSEHTSLISASDYQATVQLHDK